MGDPVVRMGARQFRELGLLQELNRRFLHPLGMALETIQDPATGEEGFGQVWDYRDDPEGVHFAEPLPVEPALYVRELERKHIGGRIALFGGMVQPVPGLHHAIAQALAAGRKKNERIPVLILEGDEGEAPAVIDDGAAKRVEVSIDGFVVHTIEVPEELPKDGNFITFVVRRRDMTAEQLAAVPED